MQKLVYGIRGSSVLAATIPISTFVRVETVDKRSSCASWSDSEPKRFRRAASRMTNVKRIPIDLLRTEQDRIRGALSQISERLTATDTSNNAIEDNLIASLSFLENADRTYGTAGPHLRRQLNQALYRRIHVKQDGDIHADLTEPFDTLLSPTVRDLATKSADAPAASEVDWKTWERSFNEKKPGATRAPGLTYDNLVGGTGLEPVTPSLSSWCSPN